MLLSNENDILFITFCVCFSICDHKGSAMTRQVSFNFFSVSCIVIGGEIGLNMVLLFIPIRGNRVVNAIAEDGHVSIIVRIINPVQINLSVNMMNMIRIVVVIRFLIRADQLVSADKASRRKTLAFRVSDNVIHVLFIDRLHQIYVDGFFVAGILILYFVAIPVHPEWNLNINIGFPTLGCEIVLAEIQLLVVIAVCAGLVSYLQIQIYILVCADPLPIVIKSDTDIIILSIGSLQIDGGIFPGAVNSAGHKAKSGNLVVNMIVINYLIPCGIGPLIFQKPNIRNGKLCYCFFI